MLTSHDGGSPRGRLQRTLAPATEPLTLAEAKLFLRVDGSEEDAQITALIAAARDGAEHYLRRALITQSWSLWLEGRAAGHVTLPMGPVQSVAAVILHPESGSPVTVSAALYRLDGAKRRIIFDQSLEEAEVELQYVAGYGDADDVPQAIRQGMLLHVLAMHERREGGHMPRHALELYAPYRQEAI